MPIPREKLELAIGRLTLIWAMAEHAL
ncbi:MAG: hypothetical protein K0Q60_4317, partial [Microvirga sp.]|nr:hypothetical protein [Microvirga sp.]